MTIETRWFFIGKDARMSLCSQIFNDRGLTSQHSPFEEGGLLLEQQIVAFKPTHIVFPILQMQGSIPTHLLKEGTRLFCGVSTEQWRSSYVEAGFQLECYLREERFIWRNAVLTAEAFIHEYFARTKSSISGTTFYVAGFGKVGKTAANVLRGLGAHVIVVARSDAQLGEAESLGYVTERLAPNFIAESGCLVNSIPAKWLLVEGELKFPVFDLASSPGCLLNPLSSEYYTILLGLPGKHFPVDAATALADALVRMYRG